MVSMKKLSNIVNWGDGTKILYKDKYTLTQTEKQIIKVLVSQGTPHLYRKKLWMQCSTALRELKNNPKYYQNLLEYTNKVHNSSAFQISLDLRRTFPNDSRCMRPEFLQKLKNVLGCYSVRNSTVGYCQGMNFIVARLLLVVDNEEEAFWIFVQIVECILPLNYYSDLAGLLTETTLILFLLKKHLPSLYAFLLEFSFEQSLNNFIHKWLVSLFTQNFDEKITMMIWDYLFLEGSVVLSKVVIGLLAIMQNDLLKQDNFEDIYQVFNEKPSQISTTAQLFYFIVTKKYEFDDEAMMGRFRDILQRPIIENLQEEKQKRSEENQKGNGSPYKPYRKGSKEKRCNPNWPICHYDTSVYDIPESIVLKSLKKPNVMMDYYYLLANNYPKANSRIDEFAIGGDKDVLIERRKHNCFETKIIENSILFLPDDRGIEDDLSDFSGSQESQSQEGLYDIIKQGEHFKKAMTEILNKYSPEPITDNEIKNLMKDQNGRDKP